MINIAAYARNRLCHQEEAIMLQCLLQTIHHCHFIFQIPLQVHYATSLQTLRHIGCQRELGDGA